MPSTVKLLAAASIVLATFAAGQLSAAEKKPTAGASAGVKAPGTNVLDPSGGTVQELSVADCRAMGGRVEVHDGCAALPGQDVGHKCTVGGYSACIDERNAR